MISGNNEQALEIYRELEPRLIEARGTDHPDVLALLRNEGLALRNLDRPDRALPIFNRTLEIARRMYGDDNPQTALAMMDEGIVLSKLRRYDEARSRLVPAFDIFLAKSGAEHPRTTTTAKALVELFEKTGDKDSAAKYRTYAGS
jgi:hypothetical protein